MSHCKHHMNHLDLFGHVPGVPSRLGFAVGPRSAKMEDAFAARLGCVHDASRGEKNPDENTRLKKKSIKTIHGIFMDI